MATPAIDSQVRLRPGDSSDLEEVMEVMDAAFGSRFGEAWTRSQCAGILPMAGVCLVIARDPANGHIIGFSLMRTVADESELLLLAVLPTTSCSAPATKVSFAFIWKCAMVIPLSKCTDARAFVPLGAAATIIARLTGHVSML